MVQLALLAAGMGLLLHSVTFCECGSIPPRLEDFGWLNNGTTRSSDKYRRIRHCGNGIEGQYGFKTSGG